MTTAFLDTGYLIALEALDDQHHETARRHWQGLRKEPLTLVTTSYVFGEVVTFFNSRDRHAKAVEIGQRLLASPSVRLVHVDRALFEAGWNLLQERPDKRFSLTDCVSFSVMTQQGLRDALAFDAHFEQAGFRRLPARER